MLQSLCDSEEGSWIALWGAPLVGRCVCQPAALTHGITPALRVTQVAQVVLSTSPLRVLGIPPLLYGLAASGSCVSVVGSLQVEHGEESQLIMAWCALFRAPVPSIPALGHQVLSVISSEKSHTNVCNCGQGGFCGKTKED